jgi:curved DNA-binding protein CbpA
MRLGKDVLEADLYEVLGVLPDATESEIRVAYRRQVRTSHPDLNQEDPDAVPRMKKLNVAARVLLDPSLRRAYDRVPRGPRATGADPKPARQRAWFERRELSFDDDWVATVTSACKCKPPSTP